jgi:glycosyltransferase involved in cell wall biosynthesis
VFDAERFLGEALDSILEQTFADFRLVISDNGSTDGTEEICRAYAARDRRVAYERHQVNRGAAWNFNRVFVNCETRFFRWAAADDVFAPTCFARCAEMMAAAPASVALCYPQTLIIDESGLQVGQYDDDLDLRSPRSHERIHRLIRTVVRGNPLFGLVRTEVLGATRGHGTFPGADYVLLAEIALRGQIWELPERLFHRRLHGGASRAASPSAQAYARWLDPDGKPVEYEGLRMLREYMAAVHQAKLPADERLLCYGAVAAAWTRRYAIRRDSLGKSLRVLRRRVSRA